MFTRAPKRDRRATHELGLETLEHRQLLAASSIFGGATILHSYEPDYGTVQLDGGKLTINGTEGADHAEVRNIRSLSPWLDDRMEVTLNGSTHRFRLADVDRLYFRGFGGDDQFSNDTGTRSTIDGGSGDDHLDGGWGRDTILGGYGNDVINGHWGDDDLIGGPGDDQLFGDRGNDRLDGDQGDDQLDGGPDDDTLLGDQDDDVLRGGSGDDYMLGGSGNDSLYGGPGDDDLRGGSGDDGLFGGIDSDSDAMTGNSGDDRFLVGDGTPEHVVDQNGNDLQVTFRNGPGGEKEFNGFSGTFEFEAGEWTDDEVEVIDQALTELVARTHNNYLLKTDGGSELQFERWGRQLTRTGEHNIGGWSDSAGTIAMTQNRFSEGDNEVIRVVFHEVGHNWDEENPDWAGFKALSGWTNVDPHSPAYRQAENQGEDWWYLASATFARAYGHRNPWEDFATSFAAYFMDQADLTYNDGVGGAAAIPTKIDFLDDYLDDIS